MGALERRDTTPEAAIDLMNGCSYNVSMATCEEAQASWLHCATDAKDLAFSEDLLLEFFTFYSPASARTGHHVASITTFDWESEVVSIRLGQRRIPQQECCNRDMRTIRGVQSRIFIE